MNKSSLGIKTAESYPYAYNESINLEDFIDILNHAWLKTQASDKSMLGMTFDRKGIAFGIAYNSGILLLGVASIIARLSAGVFVIVVRKTVFEGRPKTMQIGLWLRNQTIFFFEKSHKSIYPRVIEVEKILKALIIIAVRTLKTKGGPKIIATGKIISRECRSLIKAAVKRKKLDSAKKRQVSLEEQMEGNIIPSEAADDQ